MEIPMAEIARNVGYVDQLSLRQFKRWNQRIRFIDFINVPIFRTQPSHPPDGLQPPMIRSVGPHISTPLGIEMFQDNHSHLTAATKLLLARMTRKTMQNHAGSHTHHERA
jgi:hypothetical protein